MRLASVTASTMLLLAAVATPSYAQLSINAGMERYVSTIDGTQTRESGWRRVAGLQYVPNVHRGWTFGYVGKFYLGTVSHKEGDPAAPTYVDDNEYKGMAHELQLRYRQASERYRRLDGIIGVGVDRWREHLVAADVKFDYQLAYLRFGFESDTTEGNGVNYSAGVRLPLYNTANLHLDQVGYDNNPIFKPRGRLSFYGQLGYLMGGAFNVVAYVDSYRLDDSPSQELFIGGVSQGPYYVLPRDIWMYGLRLELGTW